MTSPFDDPEFAAELPGMGVVHRPGMAAAMMEELAPLLAAEGIDLEDLDGDMDLGALNEALARASERHNLTLFTPVGAQRAGALALLRSFAESVAEGDHGRAAAVLAGVESEPAGDAPAVSHVIGACLGLLDAWHTDPGLRAALAATRVPRWSRASRAAGTDVLALAHEGRAFASLASLHRHGGLALFEGSALVVAASVTTIAASEKASVPEVAARLLADSRPGTTPGRDASPAARSHAPGSSFMRPHAGTASLGTGAPRRAGRGEMASGDRALRRGFGAWLESAASIAAPTVAEELEMMQALVEIGRGRGLDLQQPHDIETLVGLLCDADDAPEALGSALETLHDYVHFRLDAGRGLGGWEEAHEAVEDALEDVGPGPGPLGAVLELAEDVDPALRHAALAQTPLIAAVERLLEWVGAGRPATQTGGVRRADIEHVAGMLGVRAVGVGKRVASEPDGEAPIQALSMADVPLLAQWWEALSSAGVIEIGSSRVRHGPAAAEWRAEVIPPLELAEMVAGMFVAQTLTAPLEQGAFGAAITEESVLSLLRALAPEELGLDLPESLLPGGGTVWTLRNLERAGLLVGTDPTGTEGAALGVPDGLQAAVARGLLLVALLAQSSEG